MEIANQIICIVCSQSFPNLNHLPKQFKDLSLASCITCYNTIFWENSTIRDSFLESIALLEDQSAQDKLLSINPSDECELHDKEKKFYCFTDACTVCFDCAVVGDHTGHNCLAIAKLQDKQKMAAEVHLMAELIPNLHKEFFEKPLDNEKEMLITEIEELVILCINKMLTKKNEILAKIELDYIKKKNSEHFIDPQTKQLLDRAKKASNKFNSETETTEPHQTTKSDNQILKDHKILVSDFRKWVSTISKRPTKAQNSFEDDPNLKKLEDLLVIIDQLTKEDKPIHIPQSPSLSVHSGDKLEEKTQPVCSSQGIYEEKKEAALPNLYTPEKLKENTEPVFSSDVIYIRKKEALNGDAPIKREEKAVQILCDYFKVVTYRDGANFTYSPGDRNSNSWYDILLSWENSDIQALRLKLPYAKVDKVTEMGLSYLLSKKDLASLDLFIDGNALHVDEGHKMKNLFKCASSLSNLREFTFRIHESQPSYFKHQENLYLDLFGSLSHLKKLEILNLKILLLDMDDNHCLDLLRKVSNLSSLKNLSLGIQERSRISNNPICSLPAIFARMKRLEELSLRVTDCKKITQSGIQTFFETTIGGLKSLRKIQFDLTGCHGVAIQDIRIPRAWKKDRENSTITVEKIGR